jgi:hypothetical protein
MMKTIGKMVMYGDLMGKPMGKHGDISWYFTVIYMVIYHDKP